MATNSARRGRSGAREPGAKGCNGCWELFCEHWKHQAFEALGESFAKHREQDGSKRGREVGFNRSRAQSTTLAKDSIKASSHPTPLWEAASKGRDGT